MPSRLAYASGPECVYDGPLANILNESRAGAAPGHRNSEFVEAAAKIRRLCSRRETRFNQATSERVYWLLRVNRDLGYGQTKMNRLFGHLTPQQWSRIRDKAPAELPPRDGDPEAEAAAACERFARAEAALKRARTLRAYLIKQAADASAELPRPKRVGPRNAGVMEGSVRYWANTFGVYFATVQQIAGGPLVDVSWLEDDSPDARSRPYRLAEPDPPPGPLPDVDDWNPDTRPWRSFTGRQRAAARAVEAPDYDTSNVVYVVADGLRIGWFRPVHTSTGVRWGYQPRDITGTIGPDETIRSSRGDAITALITALDVVHG